MKNRKPAEINQRDVERKVNSRVDYRLELSDIPDIEAAWEESHSIRALVINGKSPVLDHLADLKRNSLGDYKKIIKVMERVARLNRVIDEKYVKQDSAKRGIYEMRAHKGHARVLFFYDEDTDQTVICTLGYWKGRGDQSRAFDQAARMMALWMQRKK